MLDKRLRTILDTLIEHGFDSLDSEFNSIDETLIPLLPPKYNDSWDKLSPAIKSLIDQKYIVGEPIYYGNYPIPNYRNVYLTYQGAHYKAFKWYEFRKDFFHSIVVPIIVSLLTTGIVTFIGYIWGNTSLENEQIPQNHNQSEHNAAYSQRND